MKLLAGYLLAQPHSGRCRAVRWSACLQMVGLSFSHNTEQTEWEEEGLEDVVGSDFSLELTDVMEDFQAFLHFHPDV